MIKSLLLSATILSVAGATNQVALYWWISDSNAVELQVDFKTNNVLVGTLNVPAQEGEARIVFSPTAGTTYNLGVKLKLQDGSVTPLMTQWYKLIRFFPHADGYNCYTDRVAYSLDTNGVMQISSGTIPCRFHRLYPNEIKPITSSPSAPSGLRIVAIDPLGDLLNIIPQP